MLDWIINRTSWFLLSLVVERLSDFKTYNFFMVLPQIVYISTIGHKIALISCNQLLISIMMKNRKCCRFFCWTDADVLDRPHLVNDQLHGQKTYTSKKYYWFVWMEVTANPVPIKQFHQEWCPIDTLRQLDFEFIFWKLL